ncbi:MAG: glycine zipper 2TM domain-containing protein [Pseudomonadota bacterium]
MRITLKTSMALAAALWVLGVAAADKPAPPATPVPTSVHGVRLATLCASCAVVKETRVETRKGKASGVGAVGGAVAGGVVGNKATDGGTLGTVGGAAVGGLLGNAIEKQIKKHKVWVTSVTLRDGSTRRFEATADPGWKAGTVVEVGADNQLKKR